MQGTPVTSATTSPQHTQPVAPTHASSPVAVLAAVHRADTGTNLRTNTTTRTPSSHKSEGSLDHSPPRIKAYPSQTQSQNDIDAPSPDHYRSVAQQPKRHVWRRSASCRDLYDYSFEDSGQAKRRVTPPAPKIDQRKLESPITRYDDTRSYSKEGRNASLEIHQDIIMSDQKVYSSSYPGTTTYSQESVEDPGNYDLRDSQDDLSHDSYELIERSDDDYSNSEHYKPPKPINTRSCSLDSGNYLPSDSESEVDKRHKCKSSTDVNTDIFALEDPRDLPREIVPRKSDGSFYKMFKTSSRTSSQESKSDYYESKSKSSKESLKKRERSFGSRTSSQESRSDYECKRSIPRNKSYESVRKHEYVESRGSSLDSKSDYYDALSKAEENNKNRKYHHEFDRKIQFERNYGTQKSKESPSNSFSFKETSHVHSISLQNVETEQSLRANRSAKNLDQNTVPRTYKSQKLEKDMKEEFNRRELEGRSYDVETKTPDRYEAPVQKTEKVTHIWPETIAGVPTEIHSWKKSRSTESESNIFSFDEDRIQSIQESDGEMTRDFSVVPDIDLKTKTDKKRDLFRDVFVEIEPRCLDKTLESQFHQPIERTKSDPNSLARQRLNSNSRRLPLMHQKTIDLTPAESSDEDYLYKQIPSAPPIIKYRGSQFEMPTAEFGHFDILKREIEGQKTKFEVPKSQFEVLGAKTQSDFINLPPKNEVDIPYVLHKRHVMNGTAGKEETIVVETKDENKRIKDDKKSKDDNKRYKEEGKRSREDLKRSRDDLKRSKDDLKQYKDDNKKIDEMESRKKKPKSPTLPEPEPTSSFLFTQNIDLSKVDPVTLEIDKSIVPIQHMSSPKRDITRIDPLVLEALNNKLSQIESDSPTSSRTDSLKPHQKAKLPDLVKVEPRIDKTRSESQRKDVEKPVKETVRISEPPVTQKIEPPKGKTEKGKLVLPEKKTKDGKPKRIIKPRMQPGKKTGIKNKTKVRITSFSSDDESLDSDDVFGSAEATPTKLEFSPPQTRKEMENILKVESERKYLQYTMSSTEVEGSPPTTRKDLLYDRAADPNFQTELRRISERSFSIPSSEDELNMKTSDMQPVFTDPIPEPALTPLQEVEDGDKSVDETLDETIGEQVTVQEFLREDDLKKIEMEREKEKELLKADIESDLKDLRVPSRTKITEISSPSLRRKGQSPLLFAHARLNLSEGSAFSLLQKQQATESPVPGRRAKSLDAPVISVSRLPPLNSFSSKDDTVEEEDQMRHLLESSDKDYEELRFSELSESDVEKKPTKKIIESYVVEPPKIVKEVLKDPLADKIIQEVISTTPREGATTRPALKPKGEVKKPDPKQKLPAKPSGKDKDQIVPDVSHAKPRRGIPPRTTSAKPPASRIASKGKTPTNKTTTQAKESQKTPLVKEKPPIKPSLDRKGSLGSVKAPRIVTKKVEGKTNAVQKSQSADRVVERCESDKETRSEKLSTQNSLALPEIKRTKSQEIESTTKRPTQKEKAKSLEKLEFKRSISKERTKSQEESDSDIAKRKEKQQMLYEIAIKQTKTLKSPVKDVLPVFPQVEEMVRERGGKLEISINTIEPNVSLEEAIIITKSPKKLDKKMDKKYTKSLELNLTVDDEVKGLQRLGNSLDLDTRQSNDGDSQEFEFDFKSETIKNIRDQDAKDEAEAVKRESIADNSDDDTFQENDLIQDNVILEGTSLDVWLTVDEAKQETDVEETDEFNGKPEMSDIAIIQKSTDFFERSKSAKPPDLGKLDAKSSSDSQSMQSMERLSLGNSLDIKYIDDSGDSSHKSEKDAKLIAELQNASEDVEKILRRRKEREEMKSPDELLDDKTLVRITSEEESLTEVSELKGETNTNLLAVDTGHRDTLLKLSIERSRSEDTGSWITVDCEEYAGAESFDYDNAPMEMERTSDDILGTSPRRSPLPDQKTDDSKPHPQILNLENKDMKQIEQEDDSKKQLSPLELKDTLQVDNSNLLNTTKGNKLDLLKRSSDQSRSSDTTGSWTSGENLSPGNAKENEESSLSCSIGQAIGLSQTIEMFASKEQLDKTSPDLENAPRSPRSPRSPRICILGRAFTIDDESIMPDKEPSSSSTDGSPHEFPKDLTPIQENESTDEGGLEGGVKYKKKPYPFEEKWSSDSELALRLQQKISKKLNSSEKSSLSSLDDPSSDKKKYPRSPLQSVEKLSTESRNSVDTESSSGSLGIANRLNRSGEVTKEPSSTWKPFPLESSGSSSLEEGVLPTDHDFYGQEYFLSRENSTEFGPLTDVTYHLKDDDLTPTADNKFDSKMDASKNDSSSGEFTYPALPGISNPDLMPGYGTAFLSRTLSRISERSTNSEKSSLDEDSTKASTQSESANESMNMSDRQGSFSSDPPSNAHVSDPHAKKNGALSMEKSNGKIPFKQMQDKTSNDTSSNDKSSNMKSLNEGDYSTNEKQSFNKPSTDRKSTSKSDIQICDPIPNFNSLLQRQISDDRRTSAEMAELSIDDIEILTSERGLRLRRQESEDTIIDEECFESDGREKKGSSSQDSDEWPLPEIPQQAQKPLLALHETPSSDTSQITTQVYQPPNKNIPKVFGLRGSLKSQDSEQWPSPPSSVVDQPIVTGNVETYYMTPPEEAYKVVVDSSTISTYDNDSNSDNENRTLDYDGEKTHTYENVASTEQISESLSDSLSGGQSGVKIVLEAKSEGSNSEEDLNISNLNDDVFTETIDTNSRNELRPPTVLRRSTTSDDSSHSGEKRKPKTPSQKGSHSSYSEEDCTSSLGTTLEDGTVRYALKPTKCTHSSHSEDTSIALSLSEWSNSNNTVKFQNLSSNSKSTNTSGLKSDDNSLTDIAQSISEWSSSNSTLKAQSLQFQKLSSTSTGDSTLTDRLATISDWSSSESKTIVGQQFFPPSERSSSHSHERIASVPERVIPDRQSISRMGSSIDDGDYNRHEVCINSPKNIPSEDVAMQSVKLTRSTERPILIPFPVLSDTEKSTESSSMEQRTVHTQRYDKERQKYSQKPSKSTERPVKVPLKLAKCSPYYSSSLSSESTPMQITSPISMSKTATIPLTRTHRKPVSKHLFQAKSPPSENDSTSSMESPKSKSDSRDRRGYRRRKQAPQKRHKVEKGVHTQDDYFYYQEKEVSEYNEYIRNKSMEEVACGFHYEIEVPVTYSECTGGTYRKARSNYTETLEEGYYPDIDSQSGSDIFRMEREDEDRYEVAESFDVSCIPPPLLEDDFEIDKQI